MYRALPMKIGISTRNWILTGLALLGAACSSHVTTSGDPGGSSMESAWQDLGLDPAGLTTLLSFLRDGDTLVCTKLDRLGRSVRDVENIVGELEEKGVGLVFTDQQIDTTTPTGKCFLQMLSVFSEFEKNMIATRRSEGIARAKSNGVRLGRKPSIDRRRVMELKQQGNKPRQ